MRTSSPLLALLLLTAAPAVAEESKTTIVTYADLDLSSPAGVMTLMKRLSRASDRVCGTRPMSVRYGQLEPYLRCRETAVANAIREIDEPAVTLAFENTVGGTSISVASR